MNDVFHGGRLDDAIARFGGERSDWLDLSTGINPNPYPIPELSEAVWSGLPDDRAMAGLLEAARNYYRVPDGFEIVAAPGTQALIELLPRVFDVGEVAIVSPTYGEHAQSWSKAGISVRQVRSLDEIGLSLKVGVVVNPDNPTAIVRPVSELIRASALLDCLIVDEAFCDGEPEHSVLYASARNLVVLKSFGKFFGLAGMRLGFAVCSSARAEKIRSFLGPWAVSGPALETGRIAFHDIPWIENTRRQLHANAKQLATCLAQFGMEIAGINPLFVYVRHDQAGWLHDYLLQHKILVRPFPAQPQFLRFGLCRDAAALSRLNLCLERYHEW